MIDFGIYEIGKNKTTGEYIVTEKLEGKICCSYDLKEIKEFICDELDEIEKQLQENEK